MRTNLRESTVMCFFACRGCSTCSFCTGGRYHLCPSGSINNLVGIFSNGGWAQFCKVPASQVYRIPDTITFQQGVQFSPSRFYKECNQIFYLIIFKLFCMQGALRGICHTLRYDGGHLQEQSNQYYHFFSVCCLSVCFFVLSKNGILFKNY